MSAHLGPGMAGGERLKKIKGGVNAVYRLSSDGTSRREIPRKRQQANRLREKERTRGQGTSLKKGGRNKKDSGCRRDPKKRNEQKK